MRQLSIVAPSKWQQAQRMQQDVLVSIHRCSVGRYFAGRWVGGGGGVCVYMQGRCNRYDRYGHGRSTIFMTTA